jgi:phytoene dehydrogenase-like protein
MSADVAVIGGGVNGLVAATLLARAGRRVVVLERRATLGGLCVTEEFHPGFRANTCVDDPGWMPPGLAATLGLEAHGYAPSWTRVGLTVPRGDKPPLVLAGDPSSAAASIGGSSPRDGERWPAFCESVARLTGMLQAIYSADTPTVGDRAPRDLWSLLTLGKKMRGLGKRGMVDFLRSVPMPVADFLDEWFEHPELKGALAFGGVVNVRHGPMSGGTTLVLLHHNVGAPRGLVNGRQTVPGGVGQLPAALAAAARSAGADLRTGTEVARIVLRNDRAAGVILTSGEEIGARHVVSSADARHTLGALCDPGDLDPEFLDAVDHIRMRGPAVRLHLALGKLPTFRSGGNAWGDEALRGFLTFAPDVMSVERAYDAAKHGRIAETPVFRATIPTLDDPTLAPPGQHVISVHAQFAAHAPSPGWTDAARARFADAIVDQIAQYAPDLRGCILGQSLVTPTDIEARYGVTEGSLLHGELALDQFLFMRPVPQCARYATPLPGLWLCGSSTHPGAGTAGASGWLAARAISRRMR